jgi:hypothetical protein
VGFAINAHFATLNQATRFHGLACDKAPHMINDTAPPIHEAYFKKDLSIAIEKIRQYENAGHFSSVIKAAKGTLSENTIRSWLSNDQKLKNAYKANKLIAVADKLDTIIDKKVSAYELALAEWKLLRSSQYKLELYKGIYKIIHDIPHEYIDVLDEIVIGVKEFYNYFWLRYLSNYKSSSSLSRTCDGYVFIKDNRLILVGIGKSASMFCSLKLNSEYNDEKITAFTGSCVIEDHRKEHISYHSKISIVNKDIFPGSEEELSEFSAKLKDNVKNTFYAV